MDVGLDDLVDSFREGDEPMWLGSVDDLLFEGESIRHSVELGDNRIVVTSHRLLAFTPESRGENYDQVELPNVSAVKAGHEAESDLVVHGLRIFMYGGALLAVGVFIDFDTFVPVDAFAGTGEAAGRIGLGSILGTMNQFLALIAQLDELALRFGALLVLLSAFVFGVYALTRDRVLVVSVAGDQADIHVPPGEDGDIETVVDELERTLSAPGDSPGGSGPEPGPGTGHGHETPDPDGNSGSESDRSDPLGG